MNSPTPGIIPIITPNEAATLAGICPTRIKNTTQAAFLVKTAIRLENLLLIGGTTGSPGDAIDMSNLATPSNPSVGCEDVGCVGFYHFADLKNGASFKCNFGQCFATHTVDSGISVIASSFRVLGSWLAWRTGDNGVVANRNAFIELQAAEFEDCCTNGTGADIRAYKNSTVECVLGTSTDSNNYALYAEDSAVIYAPGFAISGCSNYAIFANNGATINCLKTGSTGMSVAMGSTGTFAVKLERVSQLYANDCTISGTGATLLSIDTGSFADINGGTINGTSTFAVIADMCSRVDANGCTVSGTGKWQSSRGAAINLENAVINANMILAASSASTNFGAGISGSGTVTYSPATNTESSNGSWNLA